MNRIIAKAAVTVGLIVSFASLSFAATEQEKAFVDKYKKAFESKDSATLESFLYTKGADPMALEFYKMMMTSEMGSPISSIELRDLTAAEKAEAAKPMPSPDGGQAKLPLVPTKKLVIKVTTKSENGSSTSSSESFIAEADGKLMIPVPITVK